MENNPKINEKVEYIFKHFYYYSPSLKNYPDKYLPQIFSNPGNAPPHHIYLCPICLKNFILTMEGEDLKWSAEFSPDHFPPESVGGHFHILVCNPCNHNAGIEYDYVLKDLMDRKSFDNKIVSSRIKVKSSISNVPGNYSSEFYINNAGEYELSFKPSEKAHVPFVDKWIQGATTNSKWEAKVTMINPDERVISKALIKSAYLFCFANWGYEFVFSNHAEKIRKYLNDDIDYPVKTPYLWLGDSIAKANLQLYPSGLCYFQEPKGCKSFVVNIPLENIETGYKEVAPVLIPNPTVEGWESLEETHDLLIKNAENGGKVTVAHVVEFIITNKEYNGYTKTWNKVSQQ